MLNFSRAAARLNMSQPALSRHIHDLEQDLGVLLFSRKGSQVALTEAGRILQVKGLKLAEKADTLMLEMRRNQIRQRVPLLREQGGVIPRRFPVPVPDLQQLSFGNPAVVQKGMAGGKRAAIG